MVPVEYFETILLPWVEETLKEEPLPNAKKLI
jgi:hypothetical protein